MDTIQKVALVIHTLIAVLIIILVLMQRGKGADAGAAFGAGASGTVFGARGSASFFSRATAVLATAFFVSSLGLAYLSSQRTTAPASLLDEMPAEAAEVEVLPAGDDVAPESELPIAEPEIDNAAEELPTSDEPAPEGSGQQ